MPTIAEISFIREQEPKINRRNSFVLTPSRRLAAIEVRFLVNGEEYLSTFLAHVSIYSGSFPFHLPLSTPLTLPFNPLGGAPSTFFTHHVQTIHTRIHTYTRGPKQRSWHVATTTMRSNVAAAIGSVIKPDSTGKLQSFSGWTPANGSRKNKRDSIPLYRLFDPGCLFALHRSWVILSHRSSSFDNEAFDEISFLITIFFSIFGLKDIS